MALIIANSPAHAVEPLYDIDIPSMNAAEALNRLAEQTGEVMIFPYDLVVDRQSSAAIGQYTLMRALEKLLEGSGLSSGLTDERVVQIFVSDSVLEPRGSSMNSDKKVGLFGAIGSLLLAVSPSDSLGQTVEDSKVFDEILVTARKREESVFDTPMSLSTFDASTAVALNIDDLYDVGKNVPNLTVNTFGNGNLSMTGIFIRGIGLQDHWITRDPGVGVYLDGVYLGRQMGANIGLPNIERIEVARGPQGTLYGRNSIGGAVNFITKRPADNDGAKVSLKFGSRDRIAADFYGSTSLSDTVAVSLSGSTDHRGGAGDFLLIEQTDAEVGEIDRNSIRAALDFRPSDTFSLLVAVDVADDIYGQTPYDVEVFEDGAGGLSNSILSDDPYDTNSNDETITRAAYEAYGVLVNADWVLSDTYSLKLLYSHRYHEYTAGLDLAVPNNIQFPERGDARQNSLELQLNGEFDGWHFVAGLYYFDEDGFAISPFDFEGLVRIRPLDTFQETQSVAAYASATYQLTDRLALSGGLRYTEDEKDANASLDVLGLDLGPPIGIITFNPGPERVFRSDNWDAVTWDLALKYDLSDDLNTYLAVSRGYQNGGFQPRAGFAAAAAFISYDEQYAVNYEWGFKGILFERVQFSAAAFFTDYTDLQLTSDTLVPGQGFFSVISNAGEAESKGLEFDALIAVNDNFQIKTAVGYLKSEYTSLDPGTTATTVGNTSPHSPELTLLIAPQLTYETGSGGTVFASIDYSYRDEIWADATNIPVTLIDDRGLLGLNVTYESADRSWTVGVYGKNVTDETYINAIIANAGTNGPGFNQSILSNDRSEFGMRFSKSFGDL